MPRGTRKPTRVLPARNLLRSPCNAVSACNSSEQDLVTKGGIGLFQVCYFPGMLGQEGVESFQVRVGVGVSF